MDFVKNKKNWIAMGILAIVCGVAASFTPETVVAPWYSIIPPVLAVSLALMTHHVVASLAISIFVGGILSTVQLQPNQPSEWVFGLFRGLNYFFNAATDPVNLQILSFVALVMMMISVLIVSGGLHGIVIWLSKQSSGRKSTKITTAFLGLIVFVDDYANSMIVGSAMRPLSDQFKISREKLAFIVDATAAPVAGVALFSTWIGYEVGLFADASQSLGLGKDGYSMFFDAIAFRFYCFLMLAFVFINVFSGKDFGKMLKAEKRVLSSGQLLADGATPMTSKAFAKVEPHPKSNKNPWIAIISLLVFFVMLIGGLWIDGGGTTYGFWSFFSLTTWRDVISSAENNIILLALCAGTGWLISLGLSLVLSNVNPRILGRASVHGLMGSLLPILILILAWSLKGACDELKTGEYLIATLGQSVSPTFFPTIVFIVAGLTAFATGTSWGTMGILFPIVMPLAYHLDHSTYGLTTMICMGAILDGAIFGDHCSPISDTTILSSIATSCDHVDHVQTQLPYALFVAILALLVGYIPAALGMSSILSLIFGCAAIGLFFKFAARHPEREIAQ